MQVHLVPRVSAEPSKLARTDLACCVGVLGTAQSTDSEWVASSRSAHGFQIHGSCLLVNTEATHTHTHVQNIQNKIQCVPLIESFYQLIRKCFPRGNHHSANHKYSPQTENPTGKAFERWTTRRHSAVYMVLGLGFREGYVCVGVCVCFRVIKG